MERKLRARFRLNARVAERPSSRHHSCGPTFRGSIPDGIEGAFTAEEVANFDRYMLLTQRLQLCIVVEEVVDLVGRSREGMNSPRIEILLNRLFNEMDRLRDDADGLFILVINGPKEIGGEPASRGGV
ncbi:hypothetical protein [Methylorubrum aminovorans]|uniref:hypothetical protein n=1 Tax=Methylorubrum aminovorans TaxID=269069 RepID=UPI003C2BDD83